MRRRYRVAALAVTALLAGACATPEVTPVVPTARVCHARIALSGRFSVQYQQAGRDAAMYGGFRWEQQPDHTRIELLSPLGQTLAEIDVTPQRATFTPAGQPARSAPDIDALATTMLGWSLPVAGLRGWLQGCACDAQARCQALASGAGSVQGGWRIAYPAWEAEGQQSRPKRIDLQHDGEAGASAMSLRLVIDTWQPR